ncbi:hypothetical protein VTO73DRAFT_11507 [Trametes versicolor]
MIRVVKKLGLVDARLVNSQGPIRKTKNSDRTHAIPQDAPLATTPPRAKAPSVGHSTLSPGGGGAYRDHPPAHPRPSAPHAPSLEHAPAFCPPVLSVGGAAEPLPDVYAARHPRATVIPGAPLPVHPFDYLALPSYEPTLLLPYQFSTRAQMETSSVPFEIEQSLARYHDSRLRHRDRAVGRSRNGPYPRFDAPIQDQDGQYRSPRALGLDDDSRHQRVVGDVLPTQDFKLRDADPRAHVYDQPDFSASLYGTVDHNSRRPLIEDTRQAANTTSFFGVSDDKAQFALTYGVSPSAQRAPVGVEYILYDPSYNTIAHLDTTLPCARYTSMESPITPVDAPYGFHVDVASTDSIVSDASHASPYYESCRHNANWYSMQQEWQVSDYLSDGSIFPSQQTIPNPSGGHLYSRGAYNSRWSSAPCAEGHYTCYSTGLSPRQVVSLADEQRHEHTFATADSSPYNPYGPYRQLPHNTIPAQTPAIAHHPSQHAVQDYALLADPASHVARAAYSQGFTMLNGFHLTSRYLRLQPVTFGHAKRLL